MTTEIYSSRNGMNGGGLNPHYVLHLVFQYKRFSA